MISKFFWDCRRFGMTPKHLVYRLVPPLAPRVWVNSIPKSGTHLAEKAICSHPLLFRAFYPTLYQSNIDRFGGLAGICGRLTNGQAVFSHLGYKDDFKTIFQANHILPVFIYRDPRDVLLSLRDHILREPKHRHHLLFLGLSAQERLDVLLNGDVPVGVKPLFEFYRGSLGWLTSGAYALSFESLIGPQGQGSTDQQIQVLSGLYRYLGLDADKAFIARLSRDVFSKDSPTFNKGQAARWKQEIPEHTLVRLMDMGKDVFESYGYN